MASRKVLTRARKRFISSLTKNLIVVVIAAAFGGEYLFKLSGGVRVGFIVAVAGASPTLFIVGVWLAGEDKEDD